MNAGQQKGRAGKVSQTAQREDRVGHADSQVGRQTVRQAGMGWTGRQPNCSLKVSEKPLKIVIVAST